MRARASPCVAAEAFPCVTIVFAGAPVRQCPCATPLSRTRRNQPLARLASNIPLRCRREDIVGFTKLAEQRSPEAVMAMLHEAFSRFDALCTVHGVYKVRLASCSSAQSGQAVSWRQRVFPLPHACAELSRRCPLRRLRRLATATWRSRACCRGAATTRAPRCASRSRCWTPLLRWTSATAAASRCASGCTRAPSPPGSSAARARATASSEVRMLL